MLTSAKKVEVIEVEGEGFLAFLNKSICVICSGYIYTGKLVGVNTTCIKLEAPQLCMRQVRGLIKTLRMPKSFLIRGTYKYLLWSPSAQVNNLTFNHEGEQS